MKTQLLFTRFGSIAEAVCELLCGAHETVDAALYRFNHPRLAEALSDASQRGVRVRLVLDYGKFAESTTTKHLLVPAPLAMRLLHGRRGQGSKMHHKFAILDSQMVLTGSYNWTLESEDLNYENLVVLSGSEVVDAYGSEFEALWSAGSELDSASDTGVGN